MPNQVPKPKPARPAASNLHGGNVTLRGGNTTVIVHAGQGKPNTWNAHGTHGDNWQAHTDQAVAAATHVAGEIVAGAESALKAGVGAVGSLINGAVAALPKGEAAGGPQVKQQGRATTREEEAASVERHVPPPRPSDSAQQPGLLGKL